ncbi:MAG: hypothetical protein ACE5DQ_02370 [Candidatus Paceibacterota bacterium]
MEGANKVVAFMLGLLVVVFIVTIALGKVGPLKEPVVNSPFGRALGLRQPSPTPTPSEKGDSALAKLQKTSSTDDKNTVTVNKDGSITVGESTNSQAVAGARTKGGATQIPETGVSLALYPLVLAGFGAGVYLRRKSR